MVFLNGKCVAIIAADPIVARNSKTGETWYLCVNLGGLWSIDATGNPVARFYNPETRQSFDGLVVCPD